MNFLNTIEIANFIMHSTKNHVKYGTPCKAPFSLEHGSKNILITALLRENKLRDYYKNI